MSTSCHALCLGRVLVFVVLALCATSCRTAKDAGSPTLKAAYMRHFYVGVAINRTVAMDNAVRADNVNRTSDQVDKDIALVKQQFNQIAPENDLK